MRPGETPRLALDYESERLTDIAADYLREYLDKIRLSCEGLSEDQLWARPSSRSNAIGNLLLHLKGNLSLWVASTLGERAFERDRDAEFAADRAGGFGELFSGLSEVVEECRRVVSSLGAEDLDAEHEVQGYAVTGRAIVVHALEHTSYHTGQVVLLAKSLREGLGERLEFYPHFATKEGRR